MKKIDIFYHKIQKDDELRQEFANALVDGKLLDFFVDLGFDFKLSELSMLFDWLQEHDKSLFESISYELEDDPSIDIPPEVLDDMASPFAEDYIPPPEYLISLSSTTSHI